jgi:hypothetical protein
MPKLIPNSSRNKSGQTIRFWRHAVVTCAVGAIGCGGAAGDAVAPDEKSLGTFNVGIVFDAKPNAPGSGQLTFIQPDAENSTVAVTGWIAMPAIPNGVYTRFEEGTLANGVLRFRVADQSWQFDGTFTSDGNRITGRHTMTSVGVASAGGWGSSECAHHADFRFHRLPPLGVALEGGEQIGDFSQPPHAPPCREAYRRVTQIRLQPRRDHAQVALRGADGTFVSHGLQFRHLRCDPRPRREVGSETAGAGRDGSRRYDLRAN